MIFLDFLIKTHNPLLMNDKIHAAIGNCPKCGKQFWLNDVPLKGFCWGTEDKPHVQVVKKIPSSVQPYK
jgi:hypothetical protein